MLPIGQDTNLEAILDASLVLTTYNQCTNKTFLLCSKIDLNYTFIPLFTVTNLIQRIIISYWISVLASQSSPCHYTSLR